MLTAHEPTTIQLDLTMQNAHCSRLGIASGPFSGLDYFAHTVYWNSALFSMGALADLRNFLYASLSSLKWWLQVHLPWHPQSPNFVSFPGENCQFLPDTPTAGFRSCLQAGKWDNHSLFTFNNRTGVFLFLFFFWFGAKVIVLWTRLLTGFAYLRTLVHSLSTQVKKVSFSITCCCNPGTMEVRDWRIPGASWLSD